MLVTLGKIEATTTIEIRNFYVLDLRFLRVVYYRIAESVAPIVDHLLAATKQLSIMVIGSNSVAFVTHCRNYKIQKIEIDDMFGHICQRAQSCITYLGK